MKTLITRSSYANQLDEAIQKEFLILLSDFTGEIFKLKIKPLNFKSGETILVNGKLDTNSEEMCNIEYIIFAKWHENTKTCTVYITIIGEFDSVFCKMFSIKIKEFFWIKNMSLIQIANL